MTNFFNVENNTIDIAKRLHNLINHNYDNFSWLIDCLSHRLTTSHLTRRESFYYSPEQIENKKICLWKTLSDNDLRNKLNEIKDTIELLCIEIDKLPNDYNTTFMKVPEKFLKIQYKQDLVIDERIPLHQ